MAGEIKNTTTINYSKGGSIEKITLSETIDVSGNHFVRESKAASTSDGTLPLGGVTTPGEFYFYNKDATNYILIGADGSSYPIKLKPAEAARGRWNGAAVHFKSGAGTPVLDYFIADD